MTNSHVLAATMLFSITSIAAAQQSPAEGKTSFDISSIQSLARDLEPSTFRLWRSLGSAKMRPGKIDNFDDPGVKATIAEEQAKMDSIKGPIVWTLNFMSRDRNGTTIYLDHMYLGNAALKIPGQWTVNPVMIGNRKSTGGNRSYSPWELSLTIGDEIPKQLADQLKLKYRVKIEAEIESVTIHHQDARNIYPIVKLKAVKAIEVLPPTEAPMPN